MKVLTSVIVVEITPIGIQTLGWRFYIIWAIFNFLFIPTVYLFYPETAGRTLEDIDRYFRERPGLLVFKDKDAISSKRPQKYIEHEQRELRRASSADPATLRKGSRIGSVSFDPEKFNITGLEEVEKV